MKKSQILSAIALAAALGVIAPVAGVSAYKEPSGDAHGTANCADSKNAARAIEANSRYSAAIAFREAAEKANKDNATIYAEDNIDNVIVGQAVAAIIQYKAVASQPTKNAGQYFTSSKMIANNYKIQNYGQAGGTLTAVEDWTTDNVKEVIDAIKGTYGYSKIYKVWDAIQNRDQNAFNNAISGYNEVMTFNVRNANAEWAYILANNTTDSVILNDAAYTAFADLFVLTDRVEETYDAYAPNLKALKAAYNKMVNADLIRTKGATIYKNDLADFKMPGLKYFASLILEQGDVDGDFWDETVASAAELNALEGIVVDSLKACNVAREDGVIYDSIIAAAYNYGRINGLKVASDAEKRVVARTLVNYAEPKEDDEKDITIDAPQSGILGMAEGSASAVSIAAGLATALTALGAGVVAYRSARRSK